MVSPDFEGKRARHLRAASGAIVSATSIAPVGRRPHRTFCPRSRRSRGSRDRAPTPPTRRARARTRTARSATGPASPPGSRRSAPRERPARTFFRRRRRHGRRRGAHRPGPGQLRRLPQRRQVDDLHGLLHARGAAAQRRVRVSPHHAGHDVALRHDLGQEPGRGPFNPSPFAPLTAGKTGTCDRAPCPRLEQLQCILRPVGTIAAPTALGATFPTILTGVSATPRSTCQELRQDMGTLGAARRRAAPGDAGRRQRLHGRATTSRRCSAQQVGRRRTSIAGQRAARRGAPQRHAQGPLQVGTGSGVRARRGDQRRTRRGRSSSSSPTCCRSTATTTILALPSTPAVRRRATSATIPDPARSERPRGRRSPPRSARRPIVLVSSCPPAPKRWSAPRSVYFDDLRDDRRRCWSR